MTQPFSDIEKQVPWAVIPERRELCLQYPTPLPVEFPGESQVVSLS